MRALILTPTTPSASVHEKQGITRRLGLFVEALARLGAETTMAHLVPEALRAEREGDAAFAAVQSEHWGRPVALRLLPRQTRRETPWNHYGAGVLRASEQPPLQSFAGPEQARAVVALLDAVRPDLLLVHRLPAMLALLRSGRRPPLVHFDLDDVEHRVRARTALLPPLWPGKLAYLAHVPALLAAERRGAALSRATYVCSEADRARLARLGIARVRALPNAVALPPAPPPPAAEPTLLFLGAHDYPPNRDAAERLVREVLPRLRRRVPGARALVAGRGSRELPSASHPPAGAEFLGFVPDLSGLYARTAVVCCPIATGGGTRVKLVEAAAHARPLVSTRIGAEGLDFAEGSEILLRDDDEGLAAACAELLGDPARAARMGAAARARARDLYDADPVADRLAGWLAEGLPGGGSAGERARV